MAQPTTAPARPPPGVADAWALLATVNDPEVPVLSIVELGVVRDVVQSRDAFRVAITPTYSGCPAMDLIADDIRAAFARAGVTAEVVTVLSPAWTTDWMAPEAKQRLAAFGIAPPHLPAPVARIDASRISPTRRRAQALACPRCGSTATTRIAQFGSTACKALYRCEVCREPFDHFKPH